MLTAANLARSASLGQPPCDPVFISTQVECCWCIVCAASSEHVPSTCRLCLQMATAANGTAPAKEAPLLMANRQHQSARSRMSFRDDRDLEGQIRDQELKV